MTDLSDAAMRERAKWECREVHQQDGLCDVCLLRATFYIALRDAAYAEQREASADLIYELAHSMAERGLFVRDDFGEPNILAIRELEAAIRAQGGEKE